MGKIPPQQLTINSSRQSTRTSLLISLATSARGSARPLSCCSWLCTDSMKSWKCVRLLAIHAGLTGGEAKTEARASERMITKMT